MAFTKKELAVRFKDIYHELYKNIVGEYLELTGTPLKEYKRYEPDLLVSAFRRFRDKKDLLDQVSSFASLFIVVQALPNANHRTAFKFIKLYLSKQGVRMRTYREERAPFDEFYDASKRIISNDIDHENVLNRDYIDVHHERGLKEHLIKMRELMGRIVDRDQSGIVAEESFQSFIAALNHSGSSPSLNQRG